MLVPPPFLATEVTVLYVWRTPNEFSSWMWNMINAFTFMFIKTFMALNTNILFPDSRSCSFSFSSSFSFILTLDHNAEITVFSFTSLNRVHADVSIRRIEVVTSTKSFITHLTVSLIFIPDCIRVFTVASNSFITSHAFGAVTHS
jgi:hypothetical protein